MRLIDADALRKNMESVCMGIMAGTDSYNAPLKEIDNAPDIYHKQRWIPVSERLPERCKRYIVTDYGSVEESYYNSDGHWFSKNGDKLKDVTAWMPLPEPYKGENDEARDGIPS